MTTFITNTSGITFREIKHSDPDFTMTDGIKLVPRAAFKVSQRCPNNYVSLIKECINQGWLQPVAYIKESDYVWGKIAE